MNFGLSSVWTTFLFPFFSFLYSFFFNCTLFLLPRITMQTTINFTHTHIQGIILKRNHPKCNGNNVDDAAVRTHTHNTHTHTQ